MKNVKLLESGATCDAAKLTYFDSIALQHRGQEGAGILSNDHGQLKVNDMGLYQKFSKSC